MTDTPRYVDTTIATGALRGLDDDALVRFLGVPYGEPPVGELRFASPVARAPWAGVFDATAFGPKPPQPEMAAPIGAPQIDCPIGEDCLRLNVYSPSLDGERPGIRVVRCPTGSRTCRAARACWSTPSRASFAVSTQPVR